MSWYSWVNADEDDDRGLDQSGELWPQAASCASPAAFTRYRCLPHHPCQAPAASQSALSPASPAAAGSKHPLGPNSGRRIVL